MKQKDINKIKAEMKAVYFECRREGIGVNMGGDGIIQNGKYEVKYSSVVDLCAINVTQYPKETCSLNKNQLSFIFFQSQ